MKLQNRNNSGNAVNDSQVSSTYVNVMASEWSKFCIYLEIVSKNQNNYSAQMMLVSISMVSAILEIIGRKSKVSK